MNTQQNRDFSECYDLYTPFYESGERVEVTLKDPYRTEEGVYGCLTGGKKLRFYVGRSTGWKPIYLMILKRNSLGGGAVPSPDTVESIRGLGEYNRRR